MLKRNFCKIITILIMMFFLGVFFLFMVRMERKTKLEKLNGDDRPWPVDITWQEPYYGPVGIFCQLSGQVSESIKLYLREDEAYFLLPCYSNIQEAIWGFDERFFEVTVAGKQIKDGAGFEELETEALYNDGLELKVVYLSEAYGRIDRSYRLKVLKSEAMPAVFIETTSGSTTDIDADKKNTDSGVFLCIDEEGKIDSAKNITQIAAKGQSSFDMRKKNYKFKLSKGTQILGLESDKEYILLANALDASKCRNALAFSMAKQLGVPCVTDYRYVDLYVNSQYYGNYMLCHPVSKAYRIKTSGSEESFLLEVETWRERLKDTATYLDRGNDYYLEMVHPSKPNDGQVKAATEIIDRIDAQIYALGKEDSLNEISEYIDVDSFVAAYIMNVLTNDIDSGNHSTFCFFDGKKEKMVMGPIWDYDKAWGNQKEINADVRLCSYAYRWPEKLAENDEFRALIVDKLNFLEPYVQRMLESGIDEIANSIRASYDMDRIVYGFAIESVVDEGDLESNVNYLKDYYGKEYRFTKERLENKDAYCGIQFQEKTGRVYYLPKGESLGHDAFEYLLKMYRCTGFMDSHGKAITADSVFYDNTLITADFD